MSGKTVGFTLQWRHNELDGVSKQQPHGCLLNRLFGRRSKKTSKPRVTGLCVCVCVGGGGGGGFTGDRWIPSPRLPARSHDWRPLNVRWLNNSKNIGSYLTKICMHNLIIKLHRPISGHLQSQSSSVEVVPDSNVSLSANILMKTMNYRLYWRHVNTCCHVMCAYCAYVTIRYTLGGARFECRHFVNKVSGQHFSVENKQEAA